MGKGKIRDFLIASKDETINTLVENNMLPAVIEEIADSVVSEGTTEIIGILVGTFVPRINGIRLNYKQSRFERSVKNALTVMAQRIDTMEANYITYDKEQKKSKPKEVRLPNIKKPNRSTSYAITPLGRDYLRVISD